MDRLRSNRLLSAGLLCIAGGLLMIAGAVLLDVPSTATFLFIGICGSVLGLALVAAGWIRSR
ncbi:hypothetical protein [Schumannella sp. 10F1B-5-1]|uniref:hypothetical protein n=1 Tax=Schumannella sp. 10F1B-5-1 TaxID=2590780 RepID=UPI0011316A36|nr:hypothetical protein [Schumannella sp. 10F1B-5-1]TPW73347.1 hypothetical protein FJ658_05570 [Schumannella sp. 10F1B-5-1]